MKTGNPEIDQLINATLAKAEARFGTDAVSRIAASSLCTFEKAAYDSERQRPTWLYTPGLAARPYWERAQYGRLGEMITAFEQATAQIRSEILNLDTSGMSVPYDHLSVAPELIRGWKNLFFVKDYQPDAALLDKVPSIGAIVSRFRAEQLDKFELFLSVLEPGTHIPPHFGGANVKLTLHLPLWVPPGDCMLGVDGDSRTWKEGEMLVFDDTFDHEAWNRTPHKRAVLLIKAYHPELTVEEVGVLEMLAPLSLKVYRAVLQQRKVGA